jgi:membrane fusion protein, multidrug efflux system
VRLANAFLSLAASRSKLAQRQLFKQLALFLPVVLAVLFLMACGEKKEAPKPTPPEVLVADVVQQDVPIYQQWVSTLNGPINADITPKVQGYLLRQSYENGSFVKKGQLLFEIDPRQYEAALDKAKADVARAQATLEKYTADVQRDTPLAAQNAIPQKQLENDQANQSAAKAELVANRAGQQNAELNLAWTKVYSPVDGIAGVSTSQVGDLVGTSTKMVTVSQINPIWAYFNISETEYLANAADISKVLRDGKISAAAVPVEYIQANDELYPYKGSIIFVNRQITAGTGTIQLAAAFPNKDALLRPGGFGQVRMRTRNNPNALLIPQAAVIEVQTDFQVVVVNPEGRAVFRPVKVGDRVGQNWIITEGLKPGEKVVVEGYQKIQLAAAANPALAKEGVPVSAKPYVPPAGGAPGSN